MTELMIHPNRRLGAIASLEDRRTLLLANYRATVPPPPPQATWAAGVPSWPMYLNDRLGDCVIADMAHADELWLIAGGSTLSRVTDAVVQTAYSAITGYQPGSPSTDRGTVISDALRYWRKHGLGGRKIGAYASVDIGNQSLLCEGIYYLFGLTCAFALPAAAQKMGQHWTRPANTRGVNAPGSWGGHCVLAVGYDRDGVTVVSWGELIRVDWAFWHVYATEAWATLSQEVIQSKTGRDIQGFDMEALSADLAQIGRPA